uniref:Succinate dehydrogenase assembly factor 4, mitochondrial n=1 Tax=Glossina morsitans morsitans TaxID=37546 RepID=A0A1B0FKM1_GLOMM
MNVSKQTIGAISKIGNQEAHLSTSVIRNAEKFKGVLKPKSVRREEFEKKLRAKTPLGKLDEHTQHPYQEKEPLKAWPGSVNPNTGEIGGPAGPEPTRYGDWERKGRVTDF